MIRWSPSAHSFPISRARARLRCRRGGTLVDAALVLPVVLMFILGIMEYGRFLMTTQLFNTAAAAGARYAITHLQPVTLNGTTYNNNTSDVTNAITAITGGMTLGSQSTQVYASDWLGNNLGAWTTAQDGQCVTVKITGNYGVSVLGLIGLPKTIAVTAQATMDVESN